MTTNVDSHLSNEQLRIAVFGLGYVGTVCAGCLADLGHTVVGVDVAQVKVDMLNSGQSPVLEPGLTDSLQRAVQAGRLRATTNAFEAVAATDLAFVCVGTPSLPNGGQDLTYISRVAGGIGQALRERKAFYGVVIRSTVLPGSTEEVVAKAVEAESGSCVGERFAVASNPEFLREGTALADFHSPPFTIVGTSDERLRQMLEAIYREIDAPFLVTEVRAAEMVKLASNAFHAAKIVFANEVGTLCKEFGVDGRVVMDLFVQDRKLNVSDKYLRPGFAFGGSCLPKDLRALSRFGRIRDAEVPMLDAVLRSNEVHIRRAIRMVEETGKRSVGLLGLTFKPGTDDLRESPVVELAQTLLGRGHQLRIYDPYLNLARLTGANKRFIDGQIPHLAELLVPTAEEAVRASEVVVVAYDAEEFRPAIAALNGAHRLIDLAGVARQAGLAGYEGIAW